jgi:regulatory protein
MQFERERNTAFDKALTHLSATLKTEKQIRDFLSKKGYLPAVIEHVLEKLRSYNFLNDADYAQTYTQNSVKRKGNKLIKMELRAKGIAEENIEAAIDGIDGDEELQTAKNILAKYMRGKTEDKETFQKAFRYLMGKGFDYEVIRQALSEYTDLEE